MRSLFRRLLGGLVISLWLAACGSSEGELQLGEGSPPSAGAGSGGGGTAGELAGSSGASSGTSSGGSTGTGGAAGVASASVVKLAMASSAACFLRTQGQIHCWGPSTWSYGLVGVGYQPDPGDDSLTMKSVGPVALGEPAVDVCTGQHSACAVLQTGGVRCWGTNEYGSLGLGDDWQLTLGDNELPSSTPLVPLPLAATQVACGWTGACARLTDGSVWCWGGLTYKTPTPVPIGGAAQRLFGGSQSRTTCAQFADHSVRCWGLGSYGQLGFSTAAGDYPTPADSPLLDVGGEVAQMALGYEHSCARLTTGQVRCWGRNKDGYLGLGDGDPGKHFPPTAQPFVDLGGKAIDLSASSEHTCAVLEGGTLRCWGLAINGVLGLPEVKMLTKVGLDHPPTFWPTIDVGEPVLQVGVSLSQTCVLLAQGRVRCWGMNHWPRFGYEPPIEDATIGDDESPSSIPGYLVFD